MTGAFRLCALALIAALAFSGCGRREAAGSVSGQEPERPSSSAATEPPLESQKEASVPAETQPQEAGPSYISLVTQETVAKFTTPGMGEYEKAKAAFDYIIETTSLIEPVGLDLWRVRGKGDAVPSFVENRSLSVMLFGVGMCEDYAAALTTLLRGMELEAEYVPGLTYAADGSGLVDHSWTAAKIDGVWYHLDCQLEDNISRRDTIRYSYFMKGDATMAGSHKWGQSLIDSGLLTQEQNDELASGFLLEACPQDYPTPPPHSFTSANMPDTAALQADIDAELREYESANGPLDPLEMNIIPPVFALEGYPPAS